MNRSVLTVVGAVAVFGLGFVVGVFVPIDSKVSKPKKKVVSEITETRNPEGYRFVNPLLECDNFNSVLRPSMGHLQTELEVFIADAAKAGEVTEVAVYYRDLNNGPWMGIGSGQPFAPASLLKVPIMMAALKKAESDPSLLQRKFKFDNSVPQDFVNPNIADEVIKFGQSYTYQDLIYRMIVNSDNNAKNIIASVLGDAVLSQVWKDLGLESPSETTPENFISVRGYSSFFRILYNATYLNKDLSELALQIMSEAHFDRGLKGGLPAGVVLSNKFGERGFQNSDQKQLHDCGIVYSGASPYLICVMTRGNNWDAQADVIAEISRRVYVAHMNVK